MASEGERLAVLETKLDGLEVDVKRLVDETARNRRRLHNLEGFAEAYLNMQKEHRRQEDRQYQRLTNAIGLAGLCVAVGMLALAAVGLWIHTGR